MKRITIILFFLLFISQNSFAQSEIQYEDYHGYCVVLRANKSNYYKSYGRMSRKFCQYYLEQCDKEYLNPSNKINISNSEYGQCTLYMTQWNPLDDTNPALAEMHILFSQGQAMPSEV